MRRFAERSARALALGVVAAGFFLGGPVWALPAGARSLPDSVLGGTFVVEGGGSFALLQADDSFQLVKEGEEFGGGFRLVEVREDGIVVERDGARQEVHRSTTGNGQGVGRASAAVSSLPTQAMKEEPTGDLAVRLEQRTQAIESRLERRQSWRGRRGVNPAEE